MSKESKVISVCQKITLSTLPRTGGWRHFNPKPIPFLLGLLLYHHDLNPESDFMESPHSWWSWSIWWRFKPVWQFTHFLRSEPDRRCWIPPALNWALIGRWSRHLPLIGQRPEIAWHSRFAGGSFPARVSGSWEAVSRLFCDNHHPSVQRVSSSQTSPGWIRCLQGRQLGFCCS